MSWQRAAVHRQRAAALEARGRSEEAVRAYRETLRCDPENADAQLRLGLLLRELGRDEEANQAFAAALRLRSALSARPQQQLLSWSSDKIGE
jgi:tetratricopeptide (TPR) repeat protein